MKFIARAVAMLSIACRVSTAAERSENFDINPKWDGHNNRAISPEPRKIRQDFGYSATSHCGGAPGEIGGFITPAAGAAHYAKKNPTPTFNQPLRPSRAPVFPGRHNHTAPL